MLKVDFLSRKVNVLREQLRFSVRLHGNLLITEIQAGLYLNKKRLETALIVLVSLFLLFMHFLTISRFYLFLAVF